MTDATMEDADFSKREQIARLDQMHADIAVKLQTRALEPWKVAFMGMTAGAALFAAGGAFVKLIGG